MKLNHFKSMRLSNPNLDISPLSEDFKFNSACGEETTRYRIGSGASSRTSGISSGYRTSSDASETSSSGSVLSDTIIEVVDNATDKSDTLKLDDTESSNSTTDESDTLKRDDADSSTLDTDNL